MGEIQPATKAEAEMETKPRPKLTPRQGDVLDVLREFITEHGFPPTVREIGELMDISSTNAVSEHLMALEGKGYISRWPGQPRAIRVLD
jgi:repressor LexA